MRPALPLAFLVTLAGPVGCGSAQTPAALPQGEVKPPHAQIAGSAALDLAPVAEPPDIVGVLRWNSPSATASSMSRCAGLPPAIAEGGARVVIGQVLNELLGRSADVEQLGAVVALDAPVHAIVALDTASRRVKPIAAVSVGLVSLERAKGAVEASAPLTEVMPGLWRIGGKARSDAACFVAASAGSTPARLVCGDRERDVLALGPYLARTMPTLPPAERDLHAELRLAPLSAKFGSMAKQQLRGLPILAQSQISIGEPRFDAALEKASFAVQDELIALIDDADKVTVAIHVDPATCMRVSAGVQMRGARSWLAGTMAEGATRAGPPPALFWRLPKDSDIAFFGRGADPARYDEIWRTTRSLVEGYLAKENVGRPADRKALADLIGVRFGKDTSTVSASGHVPPPVASAKSGKLTPQEAFERAMGAWLGWNLVGIDEEPTTTIKYLKDLVAVYNRPALVAAAKKNLSDDDARLLPVVKVVRAPAELGKSSLALEIKLKDIPTPDIGADAGSFGAKPKTMSLTMHMLVRGEGNETWIAFGLDKAELLRRLAAVKGAPGAGTLQARPGLESLSHGKLLSGGYMTIAPMTRAFESGLSFAGALAAGAMPPELQQVAQLFSNLPHKGEGPILLTSQVQGGGAPRTEVSFQVTKPALEDISALVMAGVKLAQAFNP